MEAYSVFNPRLTQARSLSSAMSNILFSNEEYSIYGFICKFLSVIITFTCEIKSFIQLLNNNTKSNKRLFMYQE